MVGKPDEIARVAAATSVAAAAAVVAERQAARSQRLAEQAQEWEALGVLSYADGPAALLYEVAGWLEDALSRNQIVHQRDRDRAAAYVAAARSLQEGTGFHL